MAQAFTCAIVFGLNDAEIQVGNGVRDSVGASVRDSVWASVWASVGDSVYGAHDANWLGFYEYFKLVCGLDAQTQKLCGLWAVAQNAGWWLPHQGLCWISERHNILKRDERGRLHCDDGPALQYPDGWGIYASHGVRLPAWIIDEPKKIQVSTIDAETNAEIRRVMIEKFGRERFIAESGAQTMHSDDYGVLFKREMQHGEPVMFVEVVNSTPEPDGSFRNYTLRVPPAMRTAREAVAWTFGKSQTEYSPEVQT